MLFGLLFAYLASIKRRLEKSDKANTLHTELLGEVSVNVEKITRRKPAVQWKEAAKPFQCQTCKKQMLLDVTMNPPALRTKTGQLHAKSCKGLPTIRTKKNEQKRAAMAAQRSLFDEIDDTEKTLAMAFGLYGA